MTRIACAAVLSLVGLLGCGFGAEAWLTAESYTRSAGAAFADRFAVVPDPANPSNHALRLASPAHTDATVIWK